LVARRQFWHNNSVPIPTDSVSAPGQTHANEPARQVTGQLVEGAASEAAASRPLEIGGPPGPEPTRYGDWEKGGRCIDF
jgi:hypothetical protein